MREDREDQGDVKDEGNLKEGGYRRFSLKGRRFYLWRRSGQRDGRADQEGVEERRGGKGKAAFPP